MNKKNCLTKVCFIGGTRYVQPLDPTSEKKFRYLQELGELYIIGFSKSMSPNCFHEHANFYLLPQLPHPLLRYLEMFLISPILTLWLIFKYQVEVLVCQSPYEGLAGAFSKLIASLFGKKIVLVVESHGNFEEDLFVQRTILFSNIYRFLMNHTANFSINQADIFRCISNSTKQQLIKRTKSKKPIFSFTTWTDIEVFLKASEDKENQKINQIIIYTGVLIPRKGVNHLINAFAAIIERCPNSKLFLVGKEDNPLYVKELKAQIEELKLTNQVTFIPAVPQKELAQLMNKANVFVLPSLSEGLGRVIIEAMATAIPVIGSNVGGIPDLVKDGVNGFLIQPKDEITLKEKIIWLLENPHQAEQMGKNGRKFASEFFSSQIYIEGYNQIFTEAKKLLNKGESNFEVTSI